MTEKQLVIKFNTVSAREICPVCGQWMDDAPYGPALFLEDTFSAVCEGCGIKHAPALVGVLDRFWQVGWDLDKSAYPEPFERATPGAAQMADVMGVPPADDADEGRPPDPWEDDVLDLDVVDLDDIPFE